MTAIHGSQSKLIFNDELTTLSKETFQKFSNDEKKEYISQSEFRSVCESLELYFSNEKFRSVWQILVGKENKMNFEQFQSFLVFHFHDCNEEEELKQTFNALDLNHDGFIDIRDLNTKWNTYFPKSKQEIQNIIQSISSDKKKISFEEFCQCIKGNTKEEETK